MENERIKALEEELRSLENRKCEIKQQICEEKANSAQKIIGKYFLQKTNEPDIFFIIKPTAMIRYDPNLGTMISAESMRINTSQTTVVLYYADACMPLMTLIISCQEITEDEYHDYKLKAINIILKTAQEKHK